MRSIALFAGIMQLLFGDMIIGISILVTVSAISLPSFFTRGTLRSLPIEFELMFIAMVMLQFVIGETLHFYLLFPYYDKFVHFSLPLFVGFISFLVAYTLHQLKALNISTAPLMLAIIFMTLGVGAFWEILEFLSDAVLHPHFVFIPHLQGNGAENALADTMGDLIVDFLGGVIGALLGLRYIHSKSSNVKNRLLRLVKEIGTNFSLPN
jgi:hypothetical protein